MANLNKVMLMGNLTRDPEVRFTPKGTAVADIALAVNRVYSLDNGERGEETIYVDVTLWGRQAELAKQYLSKGRNVYIEGRLQMDTWEDKQTGGKRSKLKVVCENMQFLGSRDGGGGGGGRERDDAGGGDFERRSSAPPARQSNRSRESVQEPAADFDDEPNFGDDDGDDIPF